MIMEKAGQPLAARLYATATSSLVARRQGDRKL